MAAAVKAVYEFHEFWMSWRTISGVAKKASYFQLTLRSFAKISVSDSFQMLIIVSAVYKVALFGPEGTGG